MVIRKIYIVTETNQFLQRKTIGVFDFAEDAKEIALSEQLINPDSSFLIECCTIGSLSAPITVQTLEPKNFIEDNY
jgi:hypothetical protein